MMIGIGLLVLMAAAFAAWRVGGTTHKFIQKITVMPIEDISGKDVVAASHAANVKAEDAWVFSTEGMSSKYGL